MRLSLLALPGLTLLAGSAPAEGEPWRLFGGSFNTSWRSTVFHAHTEDCRTKLCEQSDFDNGNLDRSIGLRAGAERPLWRRGRLELLAGGELAVMPTEYNLSQRDVTLGELLAAAGLAWDAGVGRLYLRSGAGIAALDDGRSGLASFVEAAAEVPLGGSVAVRLGVRRASHGRPSADDFSILLVSDASLAAGPDRSAAAPGAWQFAWSFGLSEPGAGPGGSLALSSAPFSLLSVHRRFGGSSRLGLSMLTAAHESGERTDFHYGVPGNQRGKDILGFSLDWDREQRAWGKLTWRYGAGIEVASWSDDYGLLLDEDGRPLRAGVETAAMVGLEGVFPLRGGMRLVFGIEQLYWFGIRMGELRFRSGVEISP